MATIVHGCGIVVMAITVGQDLGDITMVTVTDGMIGLMADIMVYIMDMLIILLGVITDIITMDGIQGIIEITDIAIAILEEDLCFIITT